MNRIWSECGLKVLKRARNHEQIHLSLNYLVNPFYECCMGLEKKTRVVHCNSVLWSWRNWQRKTLYIDFVRRGWNELTFWLVVEMLKFFLQFWSECWTGGRWWVSFAVLYATISKTYIYTWCVFTLWQNYWRHQREDEKMQQMLQSWILQQVK